MIFFNVKRDARYCESTCEKTWNGNPRECRSSKTRIEISLARRLNFNLPRQWHTKTVQKSALSTTAQTVDWCDEDNVRNRVFSKERKRKEETKKDSEGTRRNKEKGDAREGKRQRGRESERE